MILEFADWRFRVDVDATRQRTSKYSFEHCQCGYCKNYYEAIDVAHPYLRQVVEKFGINLEGPSELMPFEPTLMLACYRVDGQIIQWGHQALSVCGVPVIPEACDEETFYLWIGEMEVPWLQQEPAEEVVSPANLPEFLDRMQKVWQLRHGTAFIYS